MSTSDDLRVIAVDWSGSSKAAVQRKTIWLAEIAYGRFVEFDGGRTRDEVVAYLIGRAKEDPRVVVGFDFAFSLPEWYLRKRGMASAAALWERVAAESLTSRMNSLGLDAWMRQPDLPFWKDAGGSPARNKRFRRTELEVSRPGARAQSVFKLVGAGMVGPGSLRGMQALHRLKAAGFRIWPFDRRSLPLVVEIYPALLKARPRAISLPVAASQSIDAFDAAVSAVAMWESRDELLTLKRDARYALEGRIWQPAAASADTRGIVVVRAGESSERQQIGYTVGVSAEVCGSTGLSLSHIVIPPGAVADAHLHDGYETAIYQLSGRVETHYGPGLAESVVTETGDFVFIPAGVPHQPRNLSDTEPASAIVARNDARDDERVVPYDP